MSLGSKAVERPSVTDELETEEVRLSDPMGEASNFVFKQSKGIKYEVGNEIYTFDVSVGGDRISWNSHVRKKVPKRKEKTVENFGIVGKIEIFYKITGDSVHFQFIGHTLIGDNISFEDTIGIEKFEEIFGTQINKIPEEKVPARNRIGLLVGGIGNVIHGLTQRK